MGGEAAASPPDELGVFTFARTSTQSVQPAGSMFWLSRNKLVGSYRRFTSTRRSQFSANAARTKPGSLPWPGKFRFVFPVAKGIIASENSRAHAMLVSASSPSAQLARISSKNGALRAPAAVAAASTRPSAPPSTHSPTIDIGDGRLAT
ncbi:hypothetical protein BH20CHL4_BH20CHL4_04210 [soil metagenome]